MNIGFSCLVLFLSFTPWSLGFNQLLRQSDALSGQSSAQGVFQEETLKTESWDAGVDVKQCQNLKPTGPIEATLCDYETVDSVKKDLYENLRDLVKAPFFRYLQMDLYRGCPFWDDNAMCTETTCALDSVDEKEVPEKWRTKTLSKVDPVPSYDTLVGCYYRDSDFCYLEDPKGTNHPSLLLLFPPRLTSLNSYAGEGARQIWRTIYQENCFTPSSLQTSLTQTNNTASEQCLEERVYYKVVSGLHASVSTHICLDYLNHTTGEWGPNLQCYITRVAAHPERLEYIYFNTVILLRAVARLGPHLSLYDYADPSDSETTARLKNVLKIAQEAGKFDELSLFNGIDAQAMKEEFKAHFRNVSRIMDCIDCDQCRLWGKVQTMGIATALKVLFEIDETSLSRSPSSNILHRSEVVALFNTLHRFSESLHAVDVFRRLASLDDLDSTSPLVASIEDRPNTTAEASRRRVDALIQFCKESTAECIGAVTSIWSRGLKSIESLFGSYSADRANEGARYDEL
uniref:Endoplasmic oxidoreductin-1 n=1 Tax=Moniliophthora roreri TaxID=221103 RepID=A0A0W0EXF6_MONRR